jgi:hypothetical protein
VVVAAVAGWGLRLEKFDEIPRFSGVADVLLVSRNSIVRPISAAPPGSPFILSLSLRPALTSSLTNSSPKLSRFWAFNLLSCKLFPFSFSS